MPQRSQTQARSVAPSSRAARFRAPIGVIIAGGAITTLAVILTSQSAHQIESTRFDAAARDTRTVLAHKIDSYSEVLFGLRGLFASQGSVSRRSFHEYITGQNSQDRLQGIQAIEFAPLVTRNGIAQFERQVRAEASDNSLEDTFTVHPRSGTGDAYIVNYIEPLEGNEPALGFDLMSEPTRKTGIIEARDSAGLAATRPIKLVQERAQERGFLLFLPVYAQDQPSATVAERRRHIIGVVLAVFRVDDMLEAISSPAGASRITQIFDVGPTVSSGPGPLSEDGLLTGFDSKVSALSSKPISTLHRFLDLDVGSRRWRLLFVPAGVFESKVEKLSGLLVGVFGAILTLLLSTLVASMTRTQSRAVGIAHRMTQDLRAREQELEAINRRLDETNQVLRDFVAIASHDMRSPLAAIVGFTQFLKEQWEQTSEETRRLAIETVDRRANDLVLLVNDLLATSQIEAGTLKPAQDAVDVRAAIEETLRDAAHQGKDISVLCEPGLVAVADRAHVTRIISNLIQNANKYGAPPVSVEGKRGAGVIEIRVRDAGPGIPEAFKPKLFEKFARAELEPTPATMTGTGLGLAIVRGLARANGGEAYLEPTEIGACFVVALPQANR